jgi:hypothetical protein
MRKLLVVLLLLAVCGIACGETLEDLYAQRDAVLRALVWLNEQTNIPNYAYRARQLRDLLFEIERKIEVLEQGGTLPPYHIIPCR